MDSFRLPQSGSCSSAGSRIEIALPTDMSRDADAAAQLTETTAPQLQPESLGRVLADLTADVSPQSGTYSVALGQLSRHLDAHPAATVAALCPRLLEQVVRGRTAQLRSNAMALFGDLVPRSAEITRLFVAQFGTTLQPAEADRHAMLAVALIATAAMRRLESDVGRMSSTESPAVTLRPPQSRRPLIQEVGEPPAVAPASLGAVRWEHVYSWIPLHKLLVARLQDADRDEGSRVPPSRLHIAMADAALEICRTSCCTLSTADESTLEQWLQVWTRTSWVLQQVVGVWLEPTDGQRLPGTSAGPCPTLSDLLEAVTSSKHYHHSPDSPEGINLVVRQQAEWLPWLYWECAALSSTRRLQAALAKSSSTLATALALLRAPAARRKRALTSTNVRTQLLHALLNGSTTGADEVDQLIRATLLGALLETCCLAQADDTATDDLVRNIEEWVVAAPTFAATSPALGIAVELIAHNTKLMVKHITNWLNVDEAAAIESAAQELLGKSASQAMELSACRMRRWAVQLIGRVASPDSSVGCDRAASNEIFTKIASCLAVPLLVLRSVSVCSDEQTEVAQVLHKFPAAVVIPSILVQEHIPAADKRTEITRFVHAIASLHRAADVDHSSDRLEEMAAECVASIFDSARAAHRDSNGSQNQSPPSSHVQLQNPGQIGLPKSVDAPVNLNTQAGSSIRAEESEIVELIATNLHSWLVLLCGDLTKTSMAPRAPTIWVRVIQVAVEKTFALASDQISLRLFGAIIGGGEVGDSKPDLPADVYKAILERCRSQMHGQPALSLELLEEDDKRQAEEAKPKVGAKYRVLVRATVREAVDTSSARLRALSVGDLVTVEAHAVHEATGQMRVRLAGTDGGWTSMVAQDGRQILERIDGADSSTPSLVQSLLFERLRPLLVLRMMPAAIICDASPGTDGIDDSLVGLISKRLTQPLEFDQVRKLGAEVFGQIVELGVVLEFCTAALENMLASNDGVIAGDHVLGAKAWVYSVCTALGRWRSQSSLSCGQVTAAIAESTVMRLLHVLQVGAPVPPPGSEDLTEEEKLSRGCTDAIAAFLCALCASDEVAAVGTAVLEKFVNQLERPDTTANGSSWVAMAISVLQVVKTVGLMFGSNTSDQPTPDNRACANDSGAQMVLMRTITPIIMLANTCIAKPPSVVEEVSGDELDILEPCDDIEDKEALIIRPAALQLVFSIVLQLKSQVLKGRLRGQIFDVCGAACCADDENTRLRGAQLAGAIITCHAAEANRDDDANAEMVGLVILLQKLATDDPSPDVARAATQLVNLGLAES